MQEQIRKYLFENDGSASSVELALCFLKMEIDQESIARRLVAPLMNDELFAYDEKRGRWLLREKPVERDVASPALTLFLALPERASHWSEWNHIAVAGKSGETWSEHPAIKGRLTESAAKKLFAELHPQKANPLIFSGAGNSKTLFAKMALDCGHAPSQWQTFSLLQLGRRLFPTLTLANLEALYRQMDLSCFEDPSPEIIMSSLMELTDTIFRRLRNKGIQSISQMQEFAEGKEYQVSFDHFAFDYDFIADLPTDPGVYIMRNRDGHIIYVGKAKNLRQRVTSYFAPEMNPDRKLQLIREQLYDLKFIETGSELEALLLEHRLINSEEPPINTQFAVHDRKARKKNRFPQIVILPASDRHRFVLYFLSPETGLREAVVDAASPNPPEMVRLIDEHFFSPATEIARQAEYELAMSWLSANADRTNSIDMRRVTTAREAARLLLQQIKNLFNEFDKIVQRA